MNLSGIGNAIYDSAALSNRIFNPPGLLLQGGIGFVSVPQYALRANRNGWCKFGYQNMDVLGMAPRSWITRAISVSKYLTTSELLAGLLYFQELMLQQGPELF
mgnify:FL=1